MFHWRKASGDGPVAFVPLLFSFQTCGPLAQGQRGRKDASVLVIRLRLRLAVKRILLDNLCMGAYRIVAGEDQRGQASLIEFSQLVSYDFAFQGAT